MAAQLKPTGRHRQSMARLASVTLRPHTLAPVMLAFTLAGCGGIVDTLGMGKNAPDEFRVVSQKPLSVPPEFELRPPQQDDGDGGEETRAQARQAVFGSEGRQDQGLDFDGSAGMSDGERALLARAGAADTPEDIRTVLNQDARAGLGSPRQEDGSFWDALMFWTDDGEDRRQAEIDRRIEALEEEKRQLEIERLEEELRELESDIKQSSASSED